MQKRYTNRFYWYSDLQQREKDRRRRVRDEKLELQKKMQEERARKALERALAASSFVKVCIIL